jgi:7-carboxy-7-deazaguanine synthase
MSSALPVNEIFESIQGEASFAGTPSVFIRLQGCDVGCPWCDTKHTWTLDERNLIGAEAMLAKSEDSDGYARMDVASLMAVIEGFSARHVVITGGEPALYDLQTLTQAVLDSGRSVQIETSGTQDLKVAKGTFVTLSPKIDMPGGFAVLDQALARADELKMPVGKLADIEAFEALLAGKARPKLIWLQPISRSPKATALCVEQAIKRGYRVSVQIHAFLGLR